MNYDDQIEKLQNQILLELSRKDAASPKASLVFQNRTEILSFLHQMPVRKVVEETILCYFLRRLRVEAGLRIEDVATATELALEIIKQLESTRVPWTVSPLAMANIAYNYQVHFAAIERLTKNSLIIASVSKLISEPLSAEPLIAQWLEEVRSDFQHRGANHLLQ